jgi:hypothetical protein
MINKGRLKSAGVMPSVKATMGNPIPWGTKSNPLAGSLNTDPTAKTPKVPAPKETGQKAPTITKAPSIPKIPKGKLNPIF